MASWASFIFRPITSFLCNLSFIKYLVPEQNWFKRLQTSLSDGAFRLSAFRCARILFPNRLKRAKGINLDSFMYACLELTLWNEKLYRNKHHSSASTKAKYTITYKRVQYVSQKEYCTLKGSWMPMPLPIMQTSLAKILCILNFIEIVNLQMRILSLCIMLLQACIICFYETLCFLIF